MDNSFLLYRQKCSYHISVSMHKTHIPTMDHVGHHTHTHTQVIWRIHFMKFDIQLSNVMNKFINFSCHFRFLIQNSALLHLFYILLLLYLFFSRFYSGATVCAFNAQKIIIIQRVRHFVGHEMINSDIIHAQSLEIKFAWADGKERIVKRVSDTINIKILL